MGSKKGSQSQLSRASFIIENSGFRVHAKSPKAGASKQISKLKPFSRELNSVLDNPKRKFVSNIFVESTVEPKETKDFDSSKAS